MPDISIMKVKMTVGKKKVIGISMNMKNWLPISSDVTIPHAKPKMEAPTTMLKASYMYIRRPSLWVRPIERSTPYSQIA